MIIAVHQPQYLPWLGYFDKIDKADCFVFHDDVQYKKNEWQNRNKIKTADGNEQGKTGAWRWLTVPVHLKTGQLIMDVGISNEADWRKKHLNFLEINYRKAPYFRDYHDLFKKLYGRKWENLCDLNIHLVECLLRALGVDTPTRKCSLLKLEGMKTGKLVNICKALKADTYLSGIGAKEYLEVDKFEREGIKVVFQDFPHPVYPQLHGEFISNLSVVDLLFNCGPDSLNIIRGKG